MVVNEHGGYIYIYIYISFIFSYWLILMHNLCLIVFMVDHPTPPSSALQTKTETMVDVGAPKTYFGR